MNKVIREIGIIGLGEMGFSIAKNLLKKEYSVYVYDIDATKVHELNKLGALIVETPIAMASQVSTILLCLPHPDISEQVIFGNDGILKATKRKLETIIETSTLTPQIVVNFEKRLKKNNIGFLSAPMFGGQSSLNNGTLWFVLEGEQTLAKKFEPLFLAIGKKVSYLGNIPQATIAKLARNICRFANVATALEVITMLHKTSKNIKPIYDLLVEDSKTNFDSVWEKAMKDYALENKDYIASKISVKDLDLALNISKELSLEMPITKATKKIHKQHLTK